MAITGDGDSSLVLTTPWTETSFEVGTFGATNTRGVTATFAAESMVIEVLPVWYEATNGQERVAEVAGEFELQWRDPTTYQPDVPRQLAFGVIAEYKPVGGKKQAVYTVTANADDAVVTAVWLANGSDDPGALHRNIRLHRGDPVSTSQITVADDDALTALFSPTPERCIFTGNPTRSHQITVPYRYTPLLKGFRWTDRGLPRTPSTVSHLTGAVSHTAWQDHNLSAIDFQTPLKRHEPGAYELAQDVTEVLRTASAAPFCLHRLGTE